MSEFEQNEHYDEASPFDGRDQIGVSPSDSRKGSSISREELKERLRDLKRNKPKAYSLMIAVITGVVMAVTLHIVTPEPKAPVDTDKEQAAVEMGKRVAQKTLEWWRNRGEGEAPTAENIPQAPSSDEAASWLPDGAGVTEKGGAESWWESDYETSSSSSDHQAGGQSPQDPQGQEEIPVERDEESAQKVPSEGDVGERDSASASPERPKPGEMINQVSTPALLASPDLQDARLDPYDLALFPKPIKDVEPVMAFSDTREGKSISRLPDPLEGSRVATAVFPVGAYRPGNVVFSSIPSVDWSDTQDVGRITGYFYPPGTKNKFKWSNMHVGRFHTATYGKAPSRSIPRTYSTLITGTRVTGANELIVSVSGGSSNAYYISVDGSPWKVLYERYIPSGMLSSAQWIVRESSGVAGQELGPNTADFAINLGGGEHTVAIAAKQKHGTILPMSGTIASFDCPDSCEMEAAYWPTLEYFERDDVTVATNIEGELKNGFAQGYITSKVTLATQKLERKSIEYRERLNSVRRGQPIKGLFVAKASGMYEIALGGLIQTYYLPKPGVYDLLDTGDIKRFTGFISVHEDQVAKNGTGGYTEEEATTIPILIRTPLDEEWRHLKGSEVVIPKTVLANAIKEIEARGEKVEPIEVKDTTPTRVPTEEEMNDPGFWMNPDGFKEESQPAAEQAGNTATQ